MKKNKCSKSYNCNCNKVVGDSCKKNSSNSSTANFAKNKGTITDNEYEVTSETSNCSKKARCK